MNPKLFKVIDKPYAIWGENLIEKNKEYLDNFDTEYFQTISGTLIKKIVAKNTDKRKRKQFLIALRYYYLSSLETLFSFICAALQSPDCIFGWILKYKVSDIREALQRIERGQALFNKHNIKVINWENIYKHLFPVLNSTKIKNGDQINEKNIKVLKYLSKTYLDETSSKEHNSIKHGLRCNFNSVKSISISEPEGNINHVIKGSEYGSSYISIMDIDDISKEYKNCNFTHQDYFVHWDPKQMYALIRIITVLIANLCNMSKRFNHHGKISISCCYLDDQIYKKAFKRLESDILNMQSGFNLSAKHINCMTKKDIEKVLKDMNFE